jgi:hypothetical protein
MIRQWSLLVLLILVPVNPVFGAEAALGIWTDNEQKHTYAFLKNNQFRFWGDKSSAEGVWQSSPGLCWRGDKKQQTGNVIIYVDTTQCCMQAEILGGKLVLSEVWQKGFDIKLTEICINRVMTKRKDMPGD